MSDKDYCPNESDFETRVQSDGRKLFRCESCGRITRTTRQHPLPSKNTASYDGTLGILWDHSTKKGPCMERFLVQSLKDPVADRRMECVKPKGHRGSHSNESRDLTWCRGVKIDVGKYV